MFPAIIYPPNYKKPRENRIIFIKWLGDEQTIQVEV